MVNMMNGPGDKMIEKILCTLPPKFDKIVVTIEDSNNLEELSLEQLHGSLKSHEQRLIEHGEEKKNSKLSTKSLIKKTFKKKDNKLSTKSLIKKTFKKKDNKLSTESLIKKTFKKKDNVKCQSHITALKNRCNIYQNLSKIIKKCLFQKRHITSV